MNEQGIAELDLLPGTAQNPRAYDIQVIPEAQSVYRGHCQKMVSVTAGPGTLLDVPLKRRPLHAGRVNIRRRPTGASGDGQGDPPARRHDGLLLALAGTSHTVTTGFDGRFKMRLEPGMYQFDYEPAPGSPAPRLTDFIVQVDDNDDPDVAPLPEEVRLPRGALVDGKVQDNAGKPVPRAIVRIFQPRCTMAEACAFPPQLLAETQSDDDGHFRVVMAVP